MTCLMIRVGVTSHFLVQCTEARGEGHSYIRVTFKCHQAPQTKGSFGDRSNQKIGGSFGARSKIMGSFSESEDIKMNTGYKSLKILAAVIVTDQSLGQIIKMTLGDKIRNWGLWVTNQNLGSLSNKR